jgi:hypothetical protein
VVKGLHTKGIVRTAAIFNTKYCSPEIAERLTEARAGGLS